MRHTTLIPRDRQGSSTQLMVLHSNSLLKLMTSFSIYIVLLINDEEEEEALCCLIGSVQRLLMS